MVPKMTISAMARLCRSGEMGSSMVSGRLKDMMLWTVDVQLACSVCERSLYEEYGRDGKRFVLGFWNVKWQDRVRYINFEKHILKW